MSRAFDAAVMRWVQRLELATRGLAALGALIILPLIVAMVFEVVSRRLLGAPTAWAYEVSYMMMGTIFMCGIAYAMQRREHVSVDLVYQRMSERQQAVVDLVGYAVLLIIVVWLTTGLYDFVLRAIERGERSGQSAWNPEVWPFRAVFVVGFAVLTLQTMLEMLKASLTVWRGQRPPGATPEPHPL